MRHESLRKEKSRGASVKEDARAFGPLLLVEEYHRRAILRRLQGRAHSRQTTSNDDHGAILWRCVHLEERQKLPERLVEDEHCNRNERHQQPAHDRRHHALGVEWFEEVRS